MAPVQKSAFHCLRISPSSGWMLVCWGEPTLLDPLYALRFSKPRTRSCCVVDRIQPAGVPQQVSLRPEALFEVFGKHKSIVITACDRPIFPPSIAIPPAVPAPAEYADTMWRFSRSGRLRSPTDLTSADDIKTVPANLTEPRNTYKHRKPSSKRHRHRKLEEVAIARVRRGAVVPGTTAHRHPNEPDPVEPFAITVEDGGVVVMELVAHQGKRKRAYRAAVLGPRVKQGEGWMEAGGGTGMSQGVSRAAGERKREKEVIEGGRGGDWGSTPAALSERRRGGLPGPGRGGCDSGGRKKKRSKSDEEGRLSQGIDCPESERRKTNGEHGDEPSVAVVVAEEEALDGVHGAPVFLGGQLFGFAIQVHRIRTFAATLRALLHVLQGYRASRNTGIEGYLCQKTHCFDALLLNAGRS